MLCESYRGSEGAIAGMEERDERPGQPHRQRAGWQWLLLLLAAALVLGNNLDAFGSLTEHEIVVGGIAQQMAADDSWGRLLIGDRNWLEKPPLPHWLAAVSVSLFGTAPPLAQDEWVVRLPSLLEGLGVILLVAALAGRWYGAAVGLMAGLVASTLHGIFLYARLAENDMVLCLILTAGMAALARALEAPPGSRAFRRWRLLFWLALGAANLTKGPLYGDLLIGSALAAYCLWQRDWRLPFRLLSPLGLLLALLLALAWPLWVWSQGELSTLLDWWFSEMGGRFDKSYYGTDQPLWYYLEAVAGQLLPWSPLLLLSLPLAWRRARAAVSAPLPAGRPRPFNRERFLLCWAFAPLLLLTLAPHRHHHYALPTLPAQAILLAAALPPLWAWLAARPALRRRWLPALLLLVAAGLAAALALPLGIPPDAEPFLLPFGLPALLGALALAAALASSARPAPAATALFALLLSLFWVFGSGLIPRNDPSAADTAFFSRVAAALPPGARLVLTGGQPVARFGFYVAHPAEGLWYPESLGARTQPGETLYIVTRGDEEPALQRLGTLERLDRSELSRFGGDPAFLYGLYRLRIAAP